MGPNPIWLVSLKEEMSPQTQIEGRACEDAGTRQPSTKQGERPQKKSIHLTL